MNESESIAFDTLLVTLAEFPPGRFETVPQFSMFHSKCQHFTFGGMIRIHFEHSNHCSLQSTSVTWT
jgi:hypothetical protein